MTKKKKSQKGKTVKRHPQIRTIDNMLLSGWPTRRVSFWLVTNGMDPVSPQTLGYYRTNFLPSEMVLPPSVYEKKINQLDVQIDTLQELYNIIEIQKRRLEPLLNTEDQYGNTHPDTRHELLLLRDTIVKAIGLEMELGIRKKAAIEIHEKKFDMNEMLKEFIKQREMRELAKVIDP